MVEQVLLRIYTVFPLSLSLSLFLFLSLYFDACTLALLLHAVCAVTAEGSMLHDPFVGCAGTHECVFICITCGFAGLHAQLQWVLVRACISFFLPHSFIHIYGSS